MSGSGAPDTVTLLVRIRGRVQGVWFRGWTLAEAGRRGLSGWVRNRSDGSVEALFSGPRPAVEAMVTACRAGPPSAQVQDVVSEPTAPPATAGFHQWPSL